MEMERRYHEEAKDLDRRRYYIINFITCFYHITLFYSLKVLYFYCDKLSKIFFIILVILFKLSDIRKGYRGLFHTFLESN